MVHLSEVIATRFHPALKAPANIRTTITGLKIICLVKSWKSWFFLQHFGWPSCKSLIPSYTHPLSYTFDYFSRLCCFRNYVFPPAWDTFTKKMWKNHGKNPGLLRGKIFLFSIMSRWATVTIAMLNNQRVK